MNIADRPELVKNIVDRLKIVRETINGPNARIRQEDFGNMLGLHRNTTGRYERGETIPDIELCAKVCTFFGVSPAWLFLGLGEMRSKDAMLNNCDSTTEFSIVKDYARVQKLQEKVESQDRDLKEIYSENRELYKSQAMLLRENGELKVTVAQLKEQLKVAEGGGKQAAAVTKAQSA